MISKSHFRFNKQERSGIFFLLLLIVGLQGGYYYVKAKSFNKEPTVALNALEQSRLDSLRNVSGKDAYKGYPFNPNYITEYKGYSLGLTPEQLDRLFAYRNQGKFVNSAKEFQAVAQVSDSLLDVISPFFQFPEWKHKTSNPLKRSGALSKEESFATRDLNTATAEDLMQINGIGETLSKRIVKFRDRLGGFLVDEQLNDVYGLKPEVVERAIRQFKVMDPPVIQKIGINSASAQELAKLLYIDDNLARQIVRYREQNGYFTSLDELTNVTSFPQDRIDRIKLYLAL